jgi:sarcosine oxidase delta subunit
MALFFFLQGCSRWFKVVQGCSRLFKVVTVLSSGDVYSPRIGPLCSPFAKRTLCVLSSRSDSFVALRVPLSSLWLEKVQGCSRWFKVIGVNLTICANDFDFRTDDDSSNCATRKDMATKANHGRLTKCTCLAQQKSTLQ